MKPEIGASFSLHRCTELGLDKKDVLEKACSDLGFRRFRLMSYWNIHEQKPGRYDFRELDWQVDMISRYKGTISLCLGKRQPRWPECHIPAWASALPRHEWYEALYSYLTAVVERYKGQPTITSWQLENEALLKDFGHCPDRDYNHERLRSEFQLVKKLDTRPIVMSLSDSWGYPWRKPTPDMYAMSLYRITMHGNQYHYSRRPPFFYQARGQLIRILKQRPVFIHELQAEPWLPQAIADVPVTQQLQYMNPTILDEVISYATRTKLFPIDLWGLEWWYWLANNHNEPSLWEHIASLQKNNLKLI